MSDDELPFEQDPRDTAADAAMHRIMQQLPKLQNVFDQIREYGLDDPATHIKPWAPVAAAYRLWQNASLEALTAHYHQFEQPLTIAGRAEASPQAAKEYAGMLTRLNEEEALNDYIAQHAPSLNMRLAFDEVKRRANTVDMTDIVAFRGKDTDSAPGR